MKLNLKSRKMAHLGHLLSFSIIALLSLYIASSFTSPSEEQKCSLVFPEDYAGHDYPELLSCDDLHAKLISELNNAAERARKEEAKAKAAEAEKAAQKAAQELREQEEAKALAAEKEAAEKVVYPLEAKDWYITSLYQEDRGSYSHTGVDFGVHLRTQDRAVSASRGVVTFAGEAYNTPYPGCGIMVAVYHSNYDLTTLYCHLSSILVSEGESVEAGSPVGIIGTTGLSTGIHLHFGIVQGVDIFAEERKIDPLAWLEERVR